MAGHSLSFLRIAPLNYPEAVAALYRADPQLAARPYGEQRAAILQAQLAYGDAFSRAMNRLGHAAEEIIPNIEPLQRRWAAENDRPWDPGSWQADILSAQIRSAKPEILFFQSASPLDPRMLVELRGSVPSIRLVVMHAGWIPRSGELTGVDLFLGAYPLACEIARPMVERTELLYHAFHSFVDEPVREHEKRSRALVFAGSSGIGRLGTFRTRYWLLARLMIETDLEAWLYDPQAEPNAGFEEMILQKCLECDPSDVARLLRIVARPARRGFAIRRAVERAAGRMWQDEAGGDPRRGNPLPKPIEPLPRKFPSRCHAPVFGRDLYRIFGESSCVFNCHTDVAGPFAANMRLFESTGMGACLLTENKSNLGDLFETDREVVAYDSPDDCVAKARYLMDHPGIRSEIAAAGRARTLRDHTTLRRCERVLEIVQEML